MTTQPQIEIRPALYAPKKVAARCLNMRAARLAEYLNGIWSVREEAYLMSPRKAERLLTLFNGGMDVSLVTRALQPPDEVFKEKST